MAQSVLRQIKWIVYIKAQMIILIILIIINDNNDNNDNDDNNNSKNTIITPSYSP